MCWGNNAILLRGADGRNQPPAFNYSVIGFGEDHTNFSGFDDQFILHLHFVTYKWHWLSERVGRVLPRAICYSPCLLDTGNPESYFVSELARNLEITPPRTTAVSVSPDIKDVAFFDPVFNAQNGRVVSFWWFRHEVGVRIGCNHVAILARFPLVRIERTGYPSTFEFNQGVTSNTINRLGLRGVLANKGVGLRMLCLTPQTVYAPAHVHSSQ